MFDQLLNFASGMIGQQQQAKQQSSMMKLQVQQDLISRLMPQQQPKPVAQSQPMGATYAAPAASDNTMLYAAPAASDNTMLYVAAGGAALLVLMMMVKR